MSEETIEELIRSERLREAAARCHAQGDVTRAVDLLERAAAFEDAAHLAVEHGMGARAMRLVAALGSDELLAQASRRMEEPEARALGHEFLARGYGRAAAYAFRAAGMRMEEGRAWEHAGILLEAALAYRRGGEDLLAARALNGRLQQEPGDSRAALELGRLLLVHGKLDRAAKILQGIPANASEEPVARSLLATIFDRLGLQEARASLGDVTEVSEEGEFENDGGQGLLFGRYRVLQQVATTVVARVFCCEDRLSNQKVAVKVLRVGAGGMEGRDAIARFAREAQALQLLRHPRIVSLVAFLSEGPAVITPWMAGGSLADVLTTVALSPERAVEIALSVLEALAEAHRLGILHRDLKPSNVLMDGAGAAYLADFGAAHVGDMAATVTAGLIGSLVYMAPELWAGGKATVASDLYGAGAILYEALTGERPAPADEISVWPTHLYDELGPAHDEVVRCLLARDPLKRPATALEAITSLQRLSFQVMAAPRHAKSSRKEGVQSSPRLFSRGNGVNYDTILHRLVKLVPVEEATLRLAKAFAQADVRALASIFRVDLEQKMLWIEELGDISLSRVQRSLGEEEEKALEHAIQALHQQGCAHGQIDREHIGLDEARGVVLAFPSQVDESRDLAQDWVAWKALKTSG